MTKWKPIPKGNTCAKNADRSLMVIHSNSGEKSIIPTISIVRDAAKNWLLAQLKSKHDLDTRPMSWMNCIAWGVISRWGFPFVGLVDVPSTDVWSLHSVIIQFWIWILDLSWNGFVNLLFVFQANIGVSNISYVPNAKNPSTVTGITSAKA